MNKQHYTIKEIAGILEVPVSTLQYWKDQFIAWLPHRGEGRKRRYHRDSIPILEYIKECYANNMSTDDIKDYLAEKYPMQHNIPSAPPAFPSSVPSAAAFPESIYPLKDIMENIMEKGFDKLSKTIANVQELREENLKLKGRVERLESVLYELRRQYEIKSDIKNDDTAITKQTKAADPPADDNQSELRERIQKMRDEGVSWKMIADKFNQEGVKNPNTKGAWERRAVQRMMKN